MVFTVFVVRETAAVVALARDVHPLFGQVVLWALVAGYAGAFDLELIGPKIDEEGYEQACTRAVHNLGNLLDELGA